ncbi:MAG TPA: nicotinate-nucleotide--dimethylbenzimidazole phosphoribosyltransferase, partial [Candidatus Merdenecus merdavium]|nr:nicotinate-nucleotide--dimethylbenzimidazole phosphoribosyltransferase [Candidatus Merdenecus merdavium]
MNLEKLLTTILPLDEYTMKETRQRWDQIAKPLHGLGTLESAFIQLSGISGSSQIELKKKALIVMCADNG